MHQQEYEVVCDGDVCERKPVGSNPAQTVPAVDGAAAEADAATDAATAGAAASAGADGAAVPDAGGDGDGGGEVPPSAVDPGVAQLVRTDRRWWRLYPKLMVHAEVTIISSNVQRRSSRGAGVLLCVGLRFFRGSVSCAPFLTVLKLERFAWSWWSAWRCVPWSRVGVRVGVLCRAFPKALFLRLPSVGPTSTYVKDSLEGFLVFHYQMRFSSTALKQKSHPTPCRRACVHLFRTLCLPLRTNPMLACHLLALAVCGYMPSS